MSISYSYKIALFLKKILISHPFLYEFVIQNYRRVNNIYQNIRYNRHRDKWLQISKHKGLVQLSRNSKEHDELLLHPYLSHYEPDQDFSDFNTDIKAIAYYLPQFHRIPENDEWWGDGFTEWTNTRKSNPLFPGHYQPREPHDDIGYYDLSDIGVIKKQVDLAKRHGIFGFCFYHYWFHGRRLLGKPVDLFLKHTDIDMPFCLCWANETWSKQWDGRDHHILIKQTFSPEDDIRFIQFLKPYFDDPRYIRVEGKPMLLVYRVNKLPSPLKTATRWRDWSLENGIGELHLVAVCHGEVDKRIPLEDIGFDAYAAFPPHNFHCDEIQSEKKIFTGGRRYDYESGVNTYIFHDNKNTVYHGCTLGWDNTPRFGYKANIYLKFSLNSYYQWLIKIIKYTRDTLPSNQQYIFINAWNEWAEGAYLEPDKKYGYSSINTTSRALFNLKSEHINNIQHQNNGVSSRYSVDYEWMKYTIKHQGEKPFAIINNLITQNSTVLEFGSSSGFFTRYLKEERNAIVDIVEIDEGCAEQASKFARDCVVCDIETFVWKSSFLNRRYDFILFADVLEHLRDPWRTLKESIELLGDNGKIILSVPNIAHVQIISSLYNNDFSYSDTGILDKTHLRFFTDLTIREMVKEAGLNICNFIPVRAPILPENCGTKRNKTTIPFRLKWMLSKKEHAYTWQFVVCCDKRNSKP